MPKITYDSRLRKSEHGSRLYETWKRMRRRDIVDPTWTRYPVFCAWATHSGYALGDRLMRYDNDLPYSPQNCYWKAPSDDDITAEWAREWRAKWDETVSKIRRHYGLPPLEGGKQ